MCQEWPWRNLMIVAPLDEADDASHGEADLFGGHPNGGCPSLCSMIYTL